MNTFRGSRTRIHMSNSRPSDPIRLLRGVKQGDPAIPIAIRDLRRRGTARAIIEGDPVKYLGDTQWKETTLDEAKSALENLFAVARSALVSPTQAAHLLNDYAVPSLLAKLGASWDISSTNLRRIDELWRSKLKNLPKLPRNLSDGAFYVPLSKGGLGFRSLEQEVQCTRFNALRAVLDKFGSAIDLRKEIGSLTDHLKKLSDQHELSQ
ncbi:hypothetical protein ACOME3_004662 [Neoechinorhynchus agilis]